MRSLVFATSSLMSLDVGSSDIASDCFSCPDLDPTFEPREYMDERVRIMGRGVTAHMSLSSDLPRAWLACHTLTTLTRPKNMGQEQFHDENAHVSVALSKGYLTYTQIPSELPEPQISCKQSSQAKIHDAAPSLERSISSCPSMALAWLYIPRMVHSSPLKVLTPPMSYGRHVVPTAS
ncbi:hypothetical protein CHU98_g7885 [Xylaria longipes]|nr:hypothetical protein CHU98_g7885 [Xylaria longipes]